MKGFRKIGTAAACLLLVCLMAVTASAAPVADCPGGCSHQAAVGTTHYDTLFEAISDASDGATVTVLTDITTDSMLTVGKPIVLDLGGKTVTGNLLSPSQAAIRFLGGGTVQNGTIAVTKGSALQATGCTVTVEKDAVFVGSGNVPTLVLSPTDAANASAEISGSISNKGTGSVIYAAPAESGCCNLYILEEAKVTNETGSGIELHCAGKLEISGGTIQAKSDGVSVHISTDRTTDLAITGGTILSAEGKPVNVTTEEGVSAPTGFITGGTFSSDPGDYAPPYGKFTDNGDGTVTLITYFTVSYQANGGTGSMDGVRINCDSALILPECGFTAPDGMDFVGWQIGTKTYQPGDSFTPEADVTVTALWQVHTHTGGKATCQEKAVCDDCGKAYGQLADHDLDFVGAYAATCTASGMNAHSKCSVCGGRFVDGVKISVSALTIPASGHSWQLVEGIAATCEDQGLLEYKQCDDCGALRVDGSTVTREDLIVPATGHVLQMVPAVQATCSEAGTQAHAYCAGCSQHFLNGAAVEKSALTTALASHVLSDWQGDATYHWKSCVDCGAVFRLDVHKDADLSGSCDDCDTALEAQKEEEPAAKTGFGWLWLLPLLIALIVVILLLVKKRKTEKV